LRRKSLKKEGVVFLNTSPFFFKRFIRSFHAA
jgi:hypothetical protein